MALVSINGFREQRQWYTDSKGSGLLMYRIKYGNGYSELKVHKPGILTDAARLADPDLVLVKNAQILSANSGLMYYSNGTRWLSDSTDTSSVSSSQIESLMMALQTGAVVDANRWKLLPYLLRYCNSLKNGFNYYAPDTTYSVGAAGSNVYYDTINGSDSNNGTTYLLAKKTVPINATALPANTKVWIAAGSTIRLSFLTDIRGLYLLNAGTVVTVYDRNTGSEIFHQPNPFELAYLGGSPTEEQRMTLYFTIEGDADTIPAYSGTNGIGIRTHGAGNIMRGFWIKGCAQGINSTLGDENCEDYVLENCARNSSWDIDNGVTMNYGGVGVNITAGGTGGGRHARFLIDQPGEDAVWNGASGACAPAMKWIDFAIRHHCRKQLSNNQHADVFQYGHTQGATIFQRGIIEHIVKEDVMLGTLGRQPIGAGLQFDLAGGAATGMKVNSVAIISNHNCWNDPFGAAGRSFDRWVNVIKRHSVFFDPANPATPLYCNPIQGAAVASTQTNCLAAFINPRFKGGAQNGDQLFNSTILPYITDTEWERHLG